MSLTGVLELRAREVCVSPLVDTIWAMRRASQIAGAMAGSVLTVIKSPSGAALCRLIQIQPHERVPLRRRWSTAREVVARGPLRGASGPFTLSLGIGMSVTWHHHMLRVLAVRHALHRYGKFPRRERHRLMLSAPSFEVCCCLRTLAMCAHRPR